MFETILNKVVSEKKQEGYSVMLESGIYRIQEFNKNFTLINSELIIKKVSVTGNLNAVADLANSFIKIFSGGRQVSDLKDSMFLNFLGGSVYEAVNKYPLVVEKSINIQYDNTLSDFIFDNVYLAYIEYISIIYKK